MIAKNFLKYAEAMALQMVLRFGAPKWALPRPTTRVLREIRAARAAAFKAAGKVRYPEKAARPSWVKVATRLARALGQRVRQAQKVLQFEDVKHQSMGRSPVLGLMLAMGGGTVRGMSAWCWAPEALG